MFTDYVFNLVFKSLVHATLNYFFPKNQLISPKLSLLRKIFKCRSLFDFINYLFFCTIFINYSDN
ncbi:hypothetical protein MtrunA17_Chr3g0083911 [Medicago truncatula]|uniref:Uncharacterized protein n=1 Tax=Medicago truncatula TaxID=3880 RepID=A0A396IKM6_MEDTR|nr:hypothetical protein MtrunA17_Chr3g0083911 [Medicago truncatula]